MEYREQQGVKQRVENYSIGKAEFVVVAEQKTGATETPLDAMRKIIARSIYKCFEADEQTCYLQTNGGNK